MKFTDDFWTNFAQGSEHEYRKEHEIFCLLQQMTFNDFIVINVAFSFLYPFILDKVCSECFHLILAVQCDRWKSRCLIPSDPFVAGVAFRECGQRAVQCFLRLVALIKLYLCVRFQEYFLNPVSFFMHCYPFCVPFLPLWRIQNYLRNQATEAWSISWLPALGNILATNPSA